MLDIGILIMVGIVLTIFWALRLKQRDKIKEKDAWKIWFVLGIIVWGGLAYYSIPYIQDFVDQETTTVVGKVVDIIEPSNKDFNYQYTYEIALSNGNIKIRSDEKTFYLELGKTYEIKCYLHTKTPIAIQQVDDLLGE